MSAPALMTGKKRLFPSATVTVELAVSVPAMSEKTPANEQDREQVRQLEADIQAVTGQSVSVGFVDGAYTGEDAAAAAVAQGIRLEVVKVPEAVRGFVLLPKRWIVERSFAWKTRFRRLVRDYERLPETVAGLHFAVFAILMLARLVATTLQCA
jgi:transposase